MELPPITKKQKQIIHSLIQFRFLNTHHIQKILKHKNPNYVLALLTDLKEKEYVEWNFDRKVFAKNHQVATWWLALKARHFLKQEGDYDLDVLYKIYREKKRKQKFINYCFSVFEISQFFESQKEKGEKISFFTQSELSKYKYFPNPLPSAYIEAETETETTRYFMDIFDEFVPSAAFRARIRLYFNYAKSGNWQANTQGAEFPFILIVCPNQARKNHTFYYAKALLQKSFQKLSIFVTTKETILFLKDKTKIWNEVK